MSVIGIEFGISTVRAATFKSGKASIIRTPSGGDVVLPSVASSPDGKWHVGHSAEKCLKANSGAHGHSLRALFFERLLMLNDGTRDLPASNTTQEEDSIARLSAEEIAALVLAKVKANCESELGQPVEQAVIAVSPALNFRHYQALRDAGRLCGLEVARVLPTTSMRAMLHRLSSRSETRIVTLDIADGYVEVGCADIGDGVVEIKGCAAVALAVEEGSEQRPDINGASQTDSDVKWRITAALKQCLSGVEAGWASGVRTVLLGDALASTPGLSEAVAAVVGSSAEILKSSRRQVALGAAVEGAVIAGNVKDMLLLDVVPHTIALETAGGIASPMIPGGATWPTKKAQVFSTFRDNDTSLSFSVVQGSNVMSAKNVPMGTFVYDRIAAAPRGVPRIEVTFEVNSNVILCCSARELDRKPDSTLTVRLPSEMEIDGDLKNRMSTRLSNLVTE